MWLPDKLLHSIALRWLRSFGSTRIDVFGHCSQLTKNSYSFKNNIAEFSAVSAAPCRRWDRIYEYIVGVLVWCGRKRFYGCEFFITVSFYSGAVPAIPPFVPLSYRVIVTNYLSFHSNPSTPQIDRYICRTAHSHLSVRNLVWYVLTRFHSFLTASRYFPFIALGHSMIFLESEKNKWTQQMRRK